MVKRQRTMSMPLDFTAELEKMMKDYEDYLQAHEIASVAEFLRVLARHGAEPFRQAVEQWRTIYKTKRQESAR